MERRVALRHMALATGGLLVLPAWANAWTPAAVQTAQPLLPPLQAAVLTGFVDTLIPASDTPGAKDLGVSDFVQKMVADCYEPAVQQSLSAGLDALESAARATYSRSFQDCDTSQRTALLTAVEQSTEPDRHAFFVLVKNLAVQGYTTSEYVMTKFLNYTMIPGHYYGCVPAPVAIR
ncbi:gluconate 2-dehydrogenase subunit 3 family protein [Spirosoma sordidisoli]|nr:gluconate 2-dehydrogenase subunit 3 family protein [Spirosoma sordidisoli]